MISEHVHIPVTLTTYSSERINKGIWLVLMHINRIPPHVGIIFDGLYSSLTIKGKETNIDFLTLEKMITQKKIETAYVELSPHPVFSIDFLRENFLIQLAKFESVKENEATCLSPLKLFFNEFYYLKLISPDLLHDCMMELSENNFLLSFCNTQPTKLNTLAIPYYNIKELNERIKTERQPYTNN
ncbi:MAG: hypothetical protein IPM51_10910 [Sphingobacteriaceae bacterium]|nr:hypothetical protein [Sphingobacteriaceae bacterium]